MIMTSDDVSVWAYTVQYNENEATSCTLVGWLHVR